MRLVCNFIGYKLFGVGSVELFYCCWWCWFEIESCDGVWGYYRFLVC